jgi:hypothetical protein
MKGTMRIHKKTSDDERSAGVLRWRLKRALGSEQGKQLMEGETQMTEYRTEIGESGLSYGTEAAEEMIRDRTRKLEGKGHPDARSAAIGQLAAEGNLKTVGEAITRSVSLAEAARKESVEDRQARIWLDRAKEEAAKRGVSLSEIMDEKVLKGEVKL